MKKALLFLAGLAVSVSAIASDTLYGIGGIPGWGNWAGPNAGQELEKTSDGVFTWSGKIEVTSYFAFASELGSTWDELTAHRFAPATKDKPVEMGDNEMKYGVDASWKIAPGEYTFVIDTNNMVLKVTETAEVEKVITYVIHGQLDGLAETDWMDYPLTATAGNDDEWTAVLTPSVTGGNFGVQQQVNGGSSEWYSAGVEFDAENTSFALIGDPAGDCSFAFPAGAAYKFVFVPSTATLTITPDSESVAAIEAAGGVAEYFNMQGVRVANPEKGIYIVRQGDKVSKQVIR